MNLEHSHPDTFLKTFFEENVPFARHTGIKLLEITTGYGSAVLHDCADTKNHMGTQHAGALFTLGEAASGAACVVIFADQLLDVRAVITRATIRYERTARGSILAKGRMRCAVGDVEREFLQTGSTAYAIDVVLEDESGVQVAVMEVFWEVLKRDGAAS